MNVRDAFTPRRIVVSILLALAAGGVVLAFTLGEEPEEVRYTHPAVRTVYPAPGDGVARQTTVFVELATGYDIKALVIDGTAIQRGDLEVITGLNRFAYTPGEGKVIETFPPGRTCPTAEFVNVTDAAAALQRFSWCFSYHH